MYQKERLERIMELLEANGYLTVQYLTEQLHYSSATVNRDLQLLEQMHRLRRSYGGVEPVRPAPVPLPARYEKQKQVKKRIARRAAEFVRAGDVIFVDGTTTTQYLAEYLVGKRNLTVITNNMALAAALSEAGVCCEVLGGCVAEPPSMLDGPATVEALMRLRADKCFFSTGRITPEGEIAIGNLFETVTRTMIDRAERSFLLVDGDKVGTAPRKTLCDLSCVHCVISDYRFPEPTRQRCRQTEFVLVE